MAQIVSDQGWNFTALCNRIGTSLFVGPDVLLRLEGLPEGSYRVAVADHVATASLREGDVTEVDVP